MKIALSVLTVLMGITCFANPNIIVSVNGNEVESKNISAEQKNCLSKQLQEVSKAKGLLRDGNSDAGKIGQRAVTIVLTANFSDPNDTLFTDAAAPSILDTIAIVRADYVRLSSAIVELEVNGRIQKECRVTTVGMIIDAILKKK